MSAMESILLVEDSAGQRELTTRLYHMTKKVFHGEVGFLTADSWDAGIKTIQGGHVSVVLLDLVLPPLGRDDTLSKVKTTDNLPPVVAFSGILDEGLREMCFENGCDDFVSKDQFNHRPEDLFERVYHAYLRRIHGRQR